MSDFVYLKADAPEEGICLLTISAPKSLNALNSSILKELNRFLDELPSEVRVLMITGDGEKSFVAGADISEMCGLDEAGALEFARLGAAVFCKVSGFLLFLYLILDKP